MVKFRRAAASLAVGACILSGTPPASAIPSCWDSTTAPVRRFFQDVNYGSTEMGRALEEARLNQRRVQLERQSANLWREYATYNADVSAHIRYNGLSDNNASLFLPMPSGVGDPTGTYCHPSECWEPPSVKATPTGQPLPRSPSSSVPPERLPAVQERPWEYEDDVSPAVQQQPYRRSPTYREQPVYPPLPLEPEPRQVLPAPQPDRAYNSMPRGEPHILYQGRLYAPVY